VVSSLRCARSSPVACREGNIWIRWWAASGGGRGWRGVQIICGSVPGAVCGRGAVSSGGGARVQLIAHWRQLHVVVDVQKTFANVFVLMVFLVRLQLTWRTTQQSC